MRLTTTDLTPCIGTMVEADLDLLLSGQAASQIRDLLEARGVLVFRHLDMDDEQQLAFTHTLGTIGNQGAGEIYKVTLDRTENPTYADYNYGNFSWHIDRTDADVPPYASILNAKKLAPTGGETEFANMYAAYEDLPEADKKLIETMRVVHKVESSYRESIPNPTEAQRATWRQHPDKVHPLVWHHRSGRKSLALSTSGTEVVGLTLEASEALLGRLMQWGTQPRYVYVHEWQLGDIVIWNNTGTMHRVRAYDVTCGRRLHRTTVLGDEPFDYARDDDGG